MGSGEAVVIFSWGIGFSRAFGDFRGLWIDRADIDRLYSESAFAADTSQAHNYQILEL